MSADRINEVMDSFDFGKVAIAMRAVGWTWGSATAEDGIPSEKELRQRARRLLNDCGPNQTLRTGGFSAYREGAEYGLEFLLDRFDTGDD